MRDINCPYCNKHQEADLEFVDIFDEDYLNEMSCNSCGKNFTFITSVSIDCEANKADCLNDGNHKYARTHIIPWSCSKMKCQTCEERRDLTELEWEEFAKEKGVTLKEIKDPFYAKERK